jgi:uncharacterized protein (TIGR00369 family)
MADPLSKDHPTKDRTFSMTWQDPKANAAKGLAMGGKEYMTALMRGEMPAPPIAVLMGFRITEIGEGGVVMVLDPSERTYNPLGTVHGGVAATVLDSVMGCAVHTTLPPGRGYTTLEIKINYLRAMSEQTGPVRAEGKLVHAGRSTAMAEGRIVDSTGKIYAAGSTTCLLFDMPGAKA